MVGFSRGQGVPLKLLSWELWLLVRVRRWCICW